MILFPSQLIFLIEVINAVQKYHAQQTVEEQPQ